MINFLKNIFTYWVDLYREIRIWYIFRSTALKNVDLLNKKHSLRVDWIGRIYGIINLPEEVQGAAPEVQQAYVLQKVTDYGNVMLNIGLADVVYPEIERVSQASYLIVLWPVFEDFNMWKIIGNTIKTSLLAILIAVAIALGINNKEYLTEYYNITIEALSSLF